MGKNGYEQGIFSGNFFGGTLHPEHGKKSIFINVNLVYDITNFMPQNNSINFSLRNSQYWISDYNLTVFVDIRIRKC